jgi:hypothetical protein
MTLSVGDIGKLATAGFHVTLLYASFSFLPKTDLPSGGLTIVHWHPRQGGAFYLGAAQG